MIIQARRVLGKALLAAWGVVVIVVGGCLLAFHLLALPAPAPTDARLAAGVEGLATEPGWHAFHFLYADCRCSRNVLGQLLHRDLAFPAETIVLFGRLDPTEHRALTSRGFRVIVVDPADAEARFGAVAAPLLVVRDPSRRIAYSGGYTTSKQAIHLADREVFTALLAGRPISPLPIFGCAVSQRLAKTTDPLGLR